MIEVANEDLNKYIASSMSCSANIGGYIIKPIRGRLLLDLSTFPSYKYCELNLKRSSGNGAVTINNEKYFTLSKVSQKIKIDISINNTIDIRRDYDSLGDLVLLSICLLNDNVTIEKQSLTDLKNSLKTCGSYTSITILGEKILASSGATINNGLIVHEIITDPPNVTSIGEKIIFNSECEILNIILKEVQPPPSSDLINILGRAASSNLNNPEELKTNNHIHAANEKYLYYKKLHQVKNMSEEINLSLSTISNHEDVFTNTSTSLLLKNKAKFSIPISNIDPYSNYILNIKAMKINGNGKLGFQVQSSNNIISKKVIVCSGKLCNESLIFSFPEPSDPNDPYFINIYRPENSSSGDVLLESVTFNKCKNIVNNYLSSDLFVGHTNAPTAISLKADAIIDPNFDILLKTRYQNFSTPLVDIDGTHKHDIIFNVEPFGFESSLWVKKNFPYFNLNIKSNHKAFGNIDEYSAENTMCITDINNIIYTKNTKVYLHEINDDFIFTQEIIKSLESKTVIVTSSLTDKFILKKYTQAVIHIKCLLSVLPIVETSALNKAFYFEKDHYFNTILNDNQTIGNMYSINASCFSGKFDYVSPYEYYISSSRRLAGSNYLIYLSKNKHHRSNLIESALVLGLSVLTNNHYYINNNRCRVVSNEMLKTIDATHIDKYQVNNINEYNTRVIQELKELESILC